jgi:hypothetical protein
MLMWANVDTGMPIPGIRARTCENSVRPVRDPISSQCLEDLARIEDAQRVENALQFSLEIDLVVP